MENDNQPLSNLAALAFVSCAGNRMPATTDAAESARWRLGGDALSEIRPGERADCHAGRHGRAGHMPGMPDQSFRCYAARIERAKLYERPRSRRSEREHAVQTSLAFGFMLAVSGASMAAACLLH